MDLSSALQKLATYRAHQSRASQDVFDKGVILLKGNGANHMGEEGWSFLEQLALASIDVGRIDVADRCLKMLSDKFPASPRVDCLTGIRMEATESSDVVMKYYDELLDVDATNAAIWKRQISLLHRTKNTARAVTSLATYLDTFYQDVEAWLELADIYASCNQYTYALQSLSHALLLNPQNSFYVLQVAEVAYTAGDLPLAMKMFLIVVDMTDGDEKEATQKPEGITIRAWFGIKLCARRLISDPRLGIASASASSTPAPNPKNLRLLDELATERVLAAYSSKGKSGAVAGKTEVNAWLTAGVL